MNTDNNVTVVIPVFNEEKYISNVIESLCNQEYKGNIEIIIVDGSSTDNTLEVIKNKSETLPQSISIKIYNNPNKHIPRSLNIACENASYDIIVRLDGHTIAPKDYISKTVRNLKEIEYNGVVGGTCVINPSNSSNKAIAISRAVCHPLGVGNASYRMENHSQDYIYTDTVPFAAFTKELWTKLKGYDEELLFDEDTDFNYRAKKLSGKVLLDSTIKLNYFARDTYKKLWDQYFKYGFWSNKTCKKHKAVPSIRKMIPALFTIFWPITLIIGFKFSLSMAAMYLFIVSVLSIKDSVETGNSLLVAINMIPCFPILHLSYGLGTLKSLLTFK